jgi:hypothetical protein
VTSEGDCGNEEEERKKEKIRRFKMKITYTQN